jgi:dipeptidyl aminopeptidase/acylaminoacyl peptidase
MESYGSWHSPITEEIVVQGSLRLSDLSVEGQEIFWVEGRPEQNGRYCVVSYSHGKKSDFSPCEYNIRTRVHEYGGLCHLHHKGELFFINYKDQHLYKMNRDKSVDCLIDHPCQRFADFVISPDEKYLYSVMEEGTNNSLVRIDIEKKIIQIIASGDDFYAEPTLSSDGKKLAWISWNHPDMSWDATILHLADIDQKGDLKNERKVAGGKDISVLNPFFSPEGLLYYASDESGFWNFHTFDGIASKPLYSIKADVSEPMWAFGTKRAAFVSYKKRSALAFIYTEEAIDRLGIIYLDDNSFEPIDTPFTALSYLTAYHEGIVFIGASPTSLAAIIYYDFELGSPKTLFEPDKIGINPKYFSIPFAIKYKTAGDLEAHAIYYPPCNPDFGSNNHKIPPPLIVECHGGPTGHRKPVLGLTQQYWTSRGFALVQINYRGSSGYGRDYRRLLFNQWGIADVEDAIHVAKHLISQNQANPDHIAITGASAGGYTVLAALTFYDFFKAGVSYFGVSDLEALAKETHKFEAHYLDKLIGKYPENLKRYHELSPLRHIDNLNTPLLLLQGGEDKIVPPAQSELIYNALRKKGVHTTYVLFPKEQHGFRAKDSMITALKSELSFYREVFIKTD